MMGIPIDGPAWLFGDNQSVIISSTIPHSNLNKRHNALSYHRVREAIAAEIMYFLHMDGKYNPSDILTKFLNWAKFWPLVQPLLFWKGETTKDPQTTVPLTQLIKAIKTAALPSGSRGVTSDNNDVLYHVDTLVNPSGNTPILSHTMSVSSHPRMSSIGQKLSSGEPKQYIEPDMVNIGRPSVPPVLDPAVLSTSSTNSNVSTAGLHGNHTNNITVPPVQLSTGIAVESLLNHGTVQPGTDIHLDPYWTLVRSRKPKI
jgi:hypothetical protein